MTTLDTQPRERQVNCRTCGRSTWNTSAICDRHEQPEPTPIARTLPIAVDDDRPTAAIPVRQVIDHDANTYDVRLDLSGHIDLHALARAIYGDPIAMREWAIAMRNPHVRGIMGAAHLRQMPAVQAALTVKLDPAEAGLAADCLSERLEQAALEPQRCEAASGDCPLFVTDGASYDVVSGRLMCDMHLAQAQGD